MDKKTTTNKGHGICLVPTQNYQEILYDIVSQLKLDLSFAATPGNIHHLSLYQGIFEKDIVIQTIEQLTNIPKKIKVKNLNLWANKIVFLNVENTLQHIHNYLFLNLFLESEGSADPQQFEGITVYQQRSFDRTGYPFSTPKAFQPHFTLAHLQTPLDPKFQELNIELPKYIEFEKIAVFEVQPKGVCKGFVYERDL